MRFKSCANFQGSYARGSGRPTLASKLIQFVMPAYTENYLETPSNNLLVDQTVGHVEEAKHMEATLALDLEKLNRC